MNPTKLIRSIFAKRLSQIDRYADYGDIIQQKTLLDLLQKAKNTEFGTKFKFNDIPISLYSLLHSSFETKK